VFDRVHRSGHKERITVRGRSFGRLGADVATGSWPVLDDEWLAESLRQPLCHQARHDVAGAARSKGDDDAHGLGRIIERRSSSDARNGETRDREAIDDRVRRPSKQVVLPGKRARWRLAPQCSLRERIFLFLWLLGNHLACMAR